MIDWDARIAEAQRQVEARAERERARSARRIDTRSKVNGGSGRAGRTPGRRSTSRPRGSRKAIGRLDPYPGVSSMGGHVVPLVLIYHAEAEGPQGSISYLIDGRAVEGQACGDAWPALAECRAAVYSLVHRDRLMGADRWRAGWKLHRRNGRTSKMVSPEGSTVWDLSRFFRERLDLAAAEEAAEFWRALDVPYGGLITMARYFLRRHLAEPVTFFGLPYNTSGIHRELAYPARTGGWAGTWRGMAYDDISAAYPHAIAAEPFPCYLSLDHLPGRAPLAAEVTVELAEAPWAPLPIWQGSGRSARERSVCYGWGTVRGWWSWRELLMAQDQGARVVAFHQFLRGDQGPTVAPFSGWLDGALELRGNLPPVAAGLAKACTSMTWAVWGMTDARDQVTTFAGHRTKGREVTVSRGTLPGVATMYVANEVHARVRERLYREGLAGGGAVYADTDGVIRPKATKNAPGWSRRYSMEVVNVAAPQWYRWAEQRGERLQWCTAGIPEGAEPDQLEEVWGKVAPEDGAPLTGSLPWSGELMAPALIDGPGQTEYPSDWRGACHGCGLVLPPAEAYPLEERDWCLSCFHALQETAAGYMPVF